MKTQSTIRLLLLGPILAALAGCATSPISKSLRQEAKPMPPAQVLKSPSAAAGTTVIWGGRIIQTINHTNGASIFVLALPLNRYEKPETDANSEGRFIARIARFADPEIFRRGRLVTVAGTIAGVETDMVQKAPYQYPVLNTKEVHLWPRIRRHYWGWGYYYPDGGWGIYPAWGWGWYYPRWYWDRDEPDGLE